MSVPFKSHFFVWQTNKEWRKEKKRRMHPTGESYCLHCMRWSSHNTRIIIQMRTSTCRTQKCKQNWFAVHISMKFILCCILNALALCEIHWIHVQWSRKKMKEAKLKKIFIKKQAKRQKEDRWRRWKRSISPEINSMNFIISTQFSTTTMPNDNKNLHYN